MQVRRIEALAVPGREALSVTQHHAAVVRRLYFEMCVIVGHPYHVPPGSTLSCPDDFGLSYRGVFYAGEKTLAVFSYAASGCEALSLSVGPAQVSTLIYSKVALAAQLSLDADLATALGIRADTIHQRTFAPASR